MGREAEMEDGMLSPLGKDPPRAFGGSVAVWTPRFRLWASRTVRE